MYFVFATSIFATVINSVYDRVENVQKAILNQNNLTKNYELELK
jgi:hypothetical protein